MKVYLKSMSSRAASKKANFEEGASKSSFRWERSTTISPEG